MKAKKILCLLLASLLLLPLIVSCNEPTTDASTDTTTVLEVTSEPTEQDVYAPKPVDYEGAEFICSAGRNQYLQHCPVRNKYILF